MSNITRQEEGASTFRGGCLGRSALAEKGGKEMFLTDQRYRGRRSLDIPETA